MIMSKILKFSVKWFLLLAAILGPILMPASGHAQTRWPPFRFSLTPTYSNSRITYKIFFTSLVEGTMSDVAIKIPLPEGTRYVEGNAQATTSVRFDGQEVTFFTSVIHQPIRVAYFTVEVTDPKLAVITARAWIAWKGDLRGDYLTDEVSLDITKPMLDWVKPASSRLQLETRAEVANDVITYFIYPKNFGGLRMWDIKIVLPIPEGTTFLSVEALPPFVSSFDGREVSFSLLELARLTEVEPLKVKVSTAGVTAPLVVTHTWATWKNVGRTVGKGIAVEEQTRTGNIIVQPHSSQQVVVDIVADVPFASYDVTSVALAKDETLLKATFYTVGAFDQSSEPLTFNFFINTDCADKPEYQAVYNHQDGRAYFQAANADQSKWNPSQPIEVELSNPGALTMLLPSHLFLESGHSQEFCWLGRVRDKSTAFATLLLDEYAPNTNEQRLFHIKF